MKKIVYWLFMLPLFALLNGCDDTDTIYSMTNCLSSKSRRTPYCWKLSCRKAVLPMTNTTLWGDFNGGAEAAVGNLEWQLEKATGSESKWGIYLLPSTFKDGKHWQTASTSYRPRKVKNVR